MILPSPFRSPEFERLLVQEMEKHGYVVSLIFDEEFYSVRVTKRGYRTSFLVTAIAARDPRVPNVVIEYWVRELAHRFSGVGVED